MSEWTQIYTPIAGSAGLSALVAGLPLVVVALLLGVWRAPAWKAALFSLATAFAVAIFAYGMPVPLAVAATGYGAAYGLFPIGWLVYSAILLFDVTVEAGCFEAIKHSLRRVSGDQRLLVLLIAFCFGAFIEGTSGFGTPVAVSASLLAGLGLPAFTAAALCLVANTAPVAFGALATPIVGLAGVTALPIGTLSAAVGRLSPLIAVFIPMYLMVLMAGWSGAVAVWPAAAACGISFAITQFLVSNFVGPYLTDIISAFASAVVLLLMISWWKPARGSKFDMQAAEAPVHAGWGAVVRAWVPYILLVVLVVIWGTAWGGRVLGGPTLKWNVPLLHNAVILTYPVKATNTPYAAVFTFNWLASAGTATFLAALLAALFTGVSLGRFASLMVGTLKRLVIPELTFAAVVALAYIMNYSGATATLGLVLARTGVLFPFFSAFLGWLGVFLTGSDTSANLLFGNLQVISARTLSLNPVLMAAVNSTAGTLGKMVSLQSIAVATAATGMARDNEAKLFLFTLKHSVGLTIVMGLLAMLFAYVFPGAIPTS
jgi:lactate permease